MSADDPDAKSAETSNPTEAQRSPSLQFSVVDGCDRATNGWRRAGVVLAATLAIVAASCSASEPVATNAPAESTPDTTVVEATTPPTTVLITREDDPNDPTNVIVVMTDDQTVEQMRWLPTVSAFMQEGTEFANSLTNYPLCGPSRATFLTGQHATNHGLDCNSGLAARFHKVETNSLGPWLQDAGVHTIHVGKYLNGYGGREETRYVPAGWDDWRALAGDTAYRYERFNMVLNGEFVQYGSDTDAYSTDVLNDHLDEALRAAPADEAFFAVFTPLAPHYQGAQAFAVPAPRHEDLVSDVLRPPNYDSCQTRDVCATAEAALNAPRLTDEQADVIDNGYQTASETLFAVDEAFERMVATLTELSELDNTVIVFTSDNGFFYGEHGIVKGKILPGREALFVPLYITGPGFSTPVVESSPVSNIDLAPTIVDIFNATPGLEMDGQSLLEPLDPDRALLIQAAKAEPGGGYFGVYADGWLFYDWGDAERNELYAPDDPLQLTTLDDDPEWDGVEARLLALTEQLMACGGPSCAVPWRVADDSPEVDPTTTENIDDAIIDDGTITVEGSGLPPTVTARARVGALEFTWEPVENADGYRYRITANDGEPSDWTRIGAVAELTLSDLDSSIEYTVEVSTRRNGKWRNGTSVTLAPLADSTDEG